MMTRCFLLDTIAPIGEIKFQIKEMINKYNYEGTFPFKTLGRFERHQS